MTSISPKHSCWFTTTLSRSIPDHSLDFLVPSSWWQRRLQPLGSPGEFFTASICHFSLILPTNSPIRDQFMKTAREDGECIPWNLTHWSRDKIAAILHTTFSNAFSWVKMYEFSWSFNKILFLRFELTIFQHWFRWWLGTDQATSHYLDQWWFILLMHICVTRP